MSCATYASFPNTTFPNSCVIGKASLSKPISAALKTCCVGGGGVKTTSDGCFTYCNVTSGVDGIYWQECLLDNVTPADIAAVDENNMGCNPSDISFGDNVTIPDGNIASTWSIPIETLTLKSDGVIVTTVVESVDSIPTTATS